MLSSVDAVEGEDNPVKISSIRSQILVLPEADPLAETPENPNAARPIVIVRIATDDGIEGIAVTFYGGAMTNALKRAVDDLGALTIGEDPHRRSDRRQIERRGTGELVLSDRPGLGLNFNQATIDRFAVA